MAGEGALESQQAIAARIPYENIAVSPANKVLNAFALGVEINRRRAQMESQMEKLVLQQQKMEQDRDLKEQEFGLKQQAMYNLANSRGDQLDLAEKKLDFQEKVGYWGRAIQEEKINQQSGQLDNAGKFQTYLSNNPYRIGSVRAKQYIEDGVRQFGDGSSASRAILNSENRRHETASRDWEKQKNDALSSLDRMINNSTSKGGIQKYFWGLPDDAWGHGKGDKGEPSRWIAYNKDTSELIPPSQEAEMAKGKHAGKIGYRTVMAPEYDAIRKQQEIVRNYQNDPDMGAAPSSHPTPSASDIEYLKKNPGQAKNFDARFGDGASSTYAQ